MSIFTWQFFTESKPTWESMLYEMKKAKVSIDIEHYIFASDKIGGEFIEVLKEKVKQGVKVRLLLDMVGSSDFYYSKASQELSKAGAEVKFWNVVSLWRIHNFTALFFRDHKKAVIVDNLVGFTGGLGIRDNMTNWLDVNARLEGAVVQEMTASFNDMWKRVDEKGFVNRIKRYRKLVGSLNFITRETFFKNTFLS